MIHLLNLLAAIALLVWGTYQVRTGMLRVFGENLRHVLARSFGNRATAMLAGLGGCAVVSIAGAAAGAAIEVGGAVAGTTVRVTGKVIEKAIDVVMPSSPEELAR